MSQEVKILSIIGVITLALLIGGIFFLSAKQPQGTDNQNGQTIYQIDYAKGEKIGTDSAKVKLVEFSDLQCPACKAYEPTVQSLRQKYQNNPDFQFIFRHYPLFPVPHKFAKMAAQALEEAGAQGKFWEYHDKLYATQDSWSTKADPTEDFAQFATQVGIDPQKVREAIKNNSYNNKIQVDIEEANKLGVNSTPTFFLNGKKLSLNNFADLAVEVENALK